MLYNKITGNRSQRYANRGRAPIMVLVYIPDIRIFEKYYRCNRATRRYLRGSIPRYIYCLICPSTWILPNSNATRYSKNRVGYFFVGTVRRYRLERSRSQSLPCSNRKRIVVPEKQRQRTVGRNRDIYWCRVCRTRIKSNIRR